MTTVYTQSALNSLKVTELRNIVREQKKQGYTTLPLNSKKQLLIESILYNQERGLPGTATVNTVKQQELPMYTAVQLNDCDINEIRSFLKQQRELGYSIPPLNSTKRVLIDWALDNIEKSKEIYGGLEEKPSAPSEPLPTEIDEDNRVGSIELESLQQRILELEGIVYDKDRRIDELEEVMFTPSAVNKDALEIEELHDHIDDITKDNQQLREDLERLKIINKEHQETIENLSQELQEQQDINDDLVNERDHAERESVAMSEEQADWESLVEGLKAEITELKRWKIYYKQQYSELKSTVEMSVELEEWEKAKELEISQLKLELGVANQKVDEQSAHIKTLTTKMTSATLVQSTIKKNPVIRLIKSRQLLQLG